MSQQQSPRKLRPSEPPTVPPPFDPELFARESESKLRVDAVPPSARPTLPPAAGPAAPPPSSIPVLALARDDLEGFEMSATARVLVRHVNGRDSLEVLAVRTAMSLPEVAAELDTLAREGVITWR